MASYLTEFNSEEEKFHFLSFVETLIKATGIPIEKKASQLITKINEISGEEYYQLGHKKRFFYRNDNSLSEEKLDEELNEDFMTIEPSNHEENSSSLESFIPLTSSSSSLEQALVDNPKDELVAKEYVFQDISHLENISDRQRELILKRLSRALEHNSTSPFLWSLYFHYYIPCTPSEKDLEELFEDAVRFNPQSNILWHMYILYFRIHL